MTDVKPLKGFLYDPHKAKQLKNVVAPPYDIISPEYRDRLYKVSPYNVIRLILGKESGKDNSSNNKYTRARANMDAWIKGGILAQDEIPSLYVYRQIYDDEGKKRSRVGFIGLMRIEDPSKKGILPHEHTLAKPKQDRMKLIKEVKANLSPIFSLYRDKTNTISRILDRVVIKDKPAVDFEFEKIRHTLWRLSDASAIGRITRAFKKERVVIADGHHRYEVARQYKELMKLRGHGPRNSDHVMMYFTDIKRDDNVLIFATHRLLKGIRQMDADTIIEKVSPFFNVKKFGSLKALMDALAKNSKLPAFGIYQGGNTYLLIALKPKVSLGRAIEGDQSLEWKKLDVAVLHRLVIKKLLSLDDSEDKIKYVRDARQTAELVRSGDYDIAFFLNPTKASQVKDVAERGDMMPQKSTYFYPKLVTGLVFHKF